MDTFFEQIISVRMTPQKKTLCVVLIILAAAVTVLSVIGALYMFQFLFLFALVIIGTWFGAVKLMENMRIEYEYILTNGDLDVDIIINKSRRKRITTIKCAEIESIKRYDFSNKGAQDIVCCDESQEAYLIIARDTNRRVMRLVMAPNEKIKSGIVKYLPRILVKDAFI